jgi:hypothetical protein
MRKKLLNQVINGSEIMYWKLMLHSWLDCLLFDRQNNIAELINFWKWLATTTGQVSIKTRRTQSNICDGDSKDLKSRFVDLLWIVNWRSVSNPPVIRFQNLNFVIRFQLFFNDVLYSLEWHCWTNRWRHGQQNNNKPAALNSYQFHLEYLRINCRLAPWRVINN